jgi:adenylate cyclase
VTARAKLSPQTQTALKVFSLTSALMLLFCLSPIYEKAELRFYDIRLQAWESVAEFTSDVQLLSIRDSSRAAGFRDQELLEFLQELQTQGVQNTVLLGTDVFQDFGRYAHLLPSNVLVIDPSSDSGRQVLLQDQENLERQLDADGILRHLEPSHEAVQLWKQLSPDWAPPDDKDLYLLPRERTATGDYAGESAFKDIPIEVLQEGLVMAKRGAGGKPPLGRVILIQRIRTSATRATKMTTPTGESTIGQVHQMLALTFQKEWDLTPAGWPTSILLYLLIVGGFVLSQSGRKPLVVCTASVVTLASMGLGCLLLLPAELDLKVVFLFSAVSVSGVLLIIFGLTGNHLFLKRFGGAEDAGFSGKESQATMVFTNLPKFLMEMERNHDQDLLKYRREYNEVLALIAERYHGKVLDYQGDAQMLGFGLRYDEDAEHPTEATSAALEIVDEVATLAARWGAPPEQLKVNVGVCTGSIALGHLGAMQKQDIAAIGDTTNTAARLMGAAMKQQLGVLVSKPTYLKADGLITGTELPPVELKGKSAPVEVYHATAVDQEWQKENRGKNKKVVPTGGTLSYQGHGQESLIITIALAIVGVVVAFMLWGDGLLQAPEAHFADRLHRTFGFQDGDPDIVLIGIDEASVRDESLANFDKKKPGFPWSRGVYAQAIDNLRKTKARGIFVDVLFKRARATDRAGDRYLARMLKEEPRLVLGGTLVRDQRNRWEKPQFFPAADQDEMFERAQIGLVHNLQEQDGKTRWGYLCAVETASHDSVEAEKRLIFPSAASALLIDNWRKLATDGESVYLGDRIIHGHVNSNGRAALQIRYGPAATADGQEPQEGSYQLVSFRRLLNPDDPIFQQLDGKYVLIGQTRADGEANDVDRVDTIAGRIKGVEVHARILDSILNDSYIRPVDPNTTEFQILIVAALTLFILARYREPKAYFSRLGLVLAVSGLTYLLAFVFFNVLIEILALWLTLFVVAASILMGRHVFTFRALTMVIPAEVAEELLFRELPRDRRLVATVLLTDIRGYTTLSEGKTAVAMLDVLNEYHKRTVACYDRYGGQALTYQGDAQIVVFGVFGKRPNPAADAAAAALELQSICDALRDEWGIESREDFDVGAGLCTGEVEVGLLGGGDNLQYSVVGETVRKAHKVQSLSDELSAPVILDEETYLASRGGVQVDDLGMVQPQGLSHEIRLYRAKSVGQESDGANRSTRDEVTDSQAGGS